VEKALWLGPQEDCVELESSLG